MGESLPAVRGEHKHACRTTYGLIGEKIAQKKLLFQSQEVLYLEPKRVPKLNYVQTDSNNVVHASEKCLMATLE